jgi:O-antigen/teichoic acid export membrane protein
LGIIQRQALRTALINFFGQAFGGFVRIIIMPLFITPAQIGLLTLLDFISGSFVMAFGMGYDQVLIKLFPKYRNHEKGHHGLLALGLLLSAVGIGLSCLIYHLFGDLFLKKDTDIQLFSRFAFLVFPLIFFRIIFYNTDHYVRMLFNTVIGELLLSVVSRVIVAVAIFLFGIAWISFDNLVYLYAFSFCLPGVILLIYALAKTDRVVLPHRSFFEQPQRQQLYQYIIFGLLMGASGSLVLYIDGLMIGNMLSLKAVGIYTTFFFAARLIVIPGRSINRIAGVVLAESWQKNDMQNIREIYEKSCSNQLLVSAYLFGIGWACIESAMLLSPKLSEYLPFIDVFIFVGLGLLVEMATGVNAMIIATSPKYRYNTYFTLVLGVLVISLNYFFILAYGVIGAAIASLIASGVVNMLRWLFLYRSYGLQPFNVKFLQALIFTAVFLAVCHFVDYQMAPLQKMILNAVLLTVIFWWSVIALKLSPDMNVWLRKMKKKFM